MTMASTASVLALFMAILPTAAWTHSAVQDEANPVRWEGSIDFSAGLTVATRQSQNLLFLAEIRRREAVSDLQIRGLYRFARQTQVAGEGFVTTDDRWRLLGRYEQDVNPGFFYYLTQTLERDGIAELALRNITGGGFGWVADASQGVRETGNLNEAGDYEWRLSGGLSYLREEFIGEPATNSLGIQAGSGFRVHFSEDFSLNHDLVVISVIDDLGDYVLASDLRLLWNLNTRFRVGFSWLLDLDSSPATGTRRDRYQYALTLGFRF